MNGYQINNCVKVKITKKFNLAPEKVFDAWLDIEQISKWMFGPSVRDEKIVRMELEPKVGGKFSFIVSRNGEEINHMGKYLEIQRPNKLIFTWGINYESEEESIVFISILPVTEGCELILEHQLHPKWQDYTIQTKKGWLHMLNKLSEIF